MQRRPRNDAEEWSPSAPQIPKASASITSPYLTGDAMNVCETIKLWSVKVLRAYWQWRAANVTKARFTGIVPEDKCQIGIVLSGGEFTPGGAYGQNYGYPIPESIDYYADKGMKIVRLPFTWERVQPAMFGELDALEMSRLDGAVDQCIARGQTVGIDVHNGGYLNGKLIGGSEVSDEAFANLWSRLASHYIDRQASTILMLMSEPYDQCARQWIRTANKAISAIRSAGARQTIVVPGSYYDGGWTWTKSDNAKIVGGGVFDPLENYMFELHQYMDGNAAGGTSEIAYSPNIGADRLVDVTQWARANGHKLFLGEFAAAEDPTSMEALDHMVRYVIENSDVWKYATWWGGGDRWMNYMFRLDPVDYADPKDEPQMAVLQKWMDWQVNEFP